jgi:putative DNA primase/helicase
MRPQRTDNVTAAVIFRLVEKCRPALLVDEADTFIRDSDDLRGLLNSGHRRGGTVIRTVGDDFEPRAFATYSACAVALIGKLPDTLHDRAIIVSLQRKRTDERVKEYRTRRTDELDILARQIARWTADNADTVERIDPTVPPGLFNRRADNWRPYWPLPRQLAGNGQNVLVVQLS